MNNPGLRHIAENIFQNLNIEDLETLRFVNRSSQKMLKNPLFWLGKHIRRGLSKKNQVDWLKAIHMTKDTDLEKFVYLYLKNSTKNQKVTDLSCYIDEDFLTNFAGMIKIHLDLKNPNASEYGRTPIHWAVMRRNTEMVKILAPLAKNIANLNEFGETLICTAVIVGDIDIVTILAPFIENPNLQDDDGDTPINLAASYGRTEIVRILAPLSENPNAPNRHGITPIRSASILGHKEIIKILAPFIKDNNNPKKASGQFEMLFRRVSLFVSDNIKKFFI